MEEAGEYLTITTGVLFKRTCTNAGIPPLPPPPRLLQQIQTYLNAFAEFMDGGTTLIKLRHWPVKLKLLYLYTHAPTAVK